MRDILTILAVVLIAVLTTALVAPYFIDWESHRALIEAKLSQAAGTRVAIAGRIDVKLLPQPVFRLGRVTVGGAAQGEPSFTADEVDVSIATSALMRGDVQIVDATLRHPRLALAVAGPDASLLGRSVAAPDRFKFQHVAIVDGTLSVAAENGRGLDLTGLDLDAQAVSLLGPFTATGSFGPADDRRPFRLATSAFDHDRMRVKLALEGAAERPSVEIDGNLVAATASQPRLSFDGGATVSGELPLESSPARIPWRLAGHVTSDGSTIAIGDLSLQAGRDMRGLDATGSGSASLVDAPQMRLTLHAPQLDLDALAAAPETSTLPPPRGIDVLRRLGRALGGDPPRSPVALPFRLAVDLGLDTVTAGPQTLIGFDGHADVEPGRPIGLRLAAKGPTDASLSLDGRLETDPVPVFRGHLEMATRDLPRLTRWLAPVLPEAEDWARRTVPAQSLSFAGAVDLSSTGMAARDLTLTLDRSTAKGILSYTAPVGGDPGRLFADLGTDALDLDALPDVAESPVDWGALDLDLTLTAHAVTLASTGVGPIDAGDLALRLKKTGPDVTLDELSAVIGQAHVNAVGSMDAKAAKLDAHVDAPQLDALAAALAQLVPGPATGLLRARAPALSPARIDLSLAAVRGGDGALMPSTLTMHGHLAHSRVEAELRPDKPGDVDPATAPLTASLTAEADDGVALMRQLGLPVAAEPRSAIGPGYFMAAASGSAVAGFDTTASLDLAGIRMAYKGRAKPELGSGRLTLEGPDLSALLRSTGLAEPQAGRSWPVRAEADLSWHDSTLGLRRLDGRLDGTGVTGDLTFDLASPAAASGTPPRPALFGTLAIDRLDASTLAALAFGTSDGTQDGGAWSTAPFGPVVLRLPRSEIALKIAALDLSSGLVAKAASLTLKADRGALTLADATGTLADGRVGATLTLRRDGPSATITGSVTASGISLGGAGPTGRISGSLDVVGAAASPAGLVASLAGSGRMRLAAARIRDLDPAALSRVAALAERNTSEVDGDAITASLDGELSRAPFAFGDADGPATMAAGILRVGPLQAQADGVTAGLDAALDLRTMVLTTTIDLKGRPTVADWKGSPPAATVTLVGPLGDATTRTLDAASFVNALEARAIARDQERIDVMQQDVRERAFFNRRLKAIEADQAAERERAKAAEAGEHPPKPEEPHAPAPPLPRLAIPSETPAPGPPLPPSRPSPRARPAPAPSTKPPPAATLPPLVNVPDPSAAGRY